MNRLADRVCLVTGSTGIAASAAERFAAEGGRVFVVSRTEAHARELGDRLEAGGGDAAWVAADLTDEAAVETEVGACVERFGRIDGLFSVAGGSGRCFGNGPIHTVGPEAWDRTLELNLTTQALVCRSVVARMRTQEPNGSGTRGSILLMASVTASDWTRPTAPPGAAHGSRSSCSSGADGPLRASQRRPRRTRARP